MRTDRLLRQIYSDAPPPGFKVRLLRSLPDFGLAQGDILEVHRYRLDPEKVTVVRRISDGFEPQCNLYTHEVQRV